jgi:transcriptional regulator with XRE-family HTH domain
MSRTKPDPLLAFVIQGLRHEHGMTQEDLAFHADVTVSALSRIERGLSDPLWGNVRAIAGALDVRLGDLGTAVEQQQPTLRSTYA